MKKKCDDGWFFVVGYSRYRWTFKLNVFKSSS